MDLEDRVKNAFELIEAEQWEKADEAGELLISLSPKSTYGYLIKMLVITRGYQSMEQVASDEFKNHYKTFMRFADEEEKKLFEEDFREPYDAFINAGIEVCEESLRHAYEERKYNWHDVVQGTLLGSYPKHQTSFRDFPDNASAKEIEAYLENKKEEEKSKRIRNVFLALLVALGSLAGGIYSIFFKALGDGETALHPALWIFLGLGLGALSFFSFIALGELVMDSGHDREMKVMLKNVQAGERARIREIEEIKKEQAAFLELYKLSD